MNPTVREVNMLLREVHKGNKATLEHMLQNYSNFHWSQLCYDKTGDTILHCAARLGFIDIIDYLLLTFTPKAVDCKNKDDKTALHEAAQFSQYEACKTLIVHGANVNALKRADWTPLMLACTKVKGEQSLQTVQLLLRNKCVVNCKNKDGWTCLHLISREGDAAILNLLSENGLDVKVKTNNGRNGLHIAALHGRLEVVKILLKLGLNIDEEDRCGNTPLHEAVLGNNIDICQELIAHDARIDVKNHSDYGLLHLAASEGHINVIKFILTSLKQDINAANKNGLTPLHCAARKGNKNTFDFLIRHGADDIKDNFNRTAFDYLQK